MMISTGAWSKDYFQKRSAANSQIRHPIYGRFYNGARTVIGGWLSTQFGLPIVIDGQPGFVQHRLSFKWRGGTLLAAIPCCGKR